MATARPLTKLHALDPEFHLLHEQAQQLYKSSNETQLEQAFQYAHSAYQLQPEFIANLNLLARIELKRLNFSAAEAWCEIGLNKNPKSISLLYSRGHIALAQNQLNQAEHYFTQVLSISRVATKALNYLAHISLLKGNHVAAFQAYSELAKTQRNNAQIQNKLFESISNLTADFYSEELELDLLRYLDFNNVDYSQLTSLATSLLKHKFQLTENGCAVELDDISKDALFLKCLTRFYFTDALFERLLITIRKSVLLACSQTLQIDKELVSLIDAIGHQCWLNESVWYITKQEQDIVEQLEILTHKVLQSDNSSGIEIESILSLILMYKPLASSSDAELICSKQWPLNSLIDQQKNEYINLSSQKNNLRSFGDSEDEVSLKVQQQYNQNPYPRWSTIGYNQPADYIESLKSHFPSLKNSLSNKRNHLDVLVAGCGTGRHALRLAKYFPKLKVTAIDLSHTALSYAQYKQETSFSNLNVEFLQGDILKINQLNKQFDVIECSGVLHHMQQPLEGLKALVGQLKPGGVIKLALYSGQARVAVTELRKLLGNKLPQSEDEIRLLREALLQNALPGLWEDLFKSPDFYSLSGCRDLIFHTQEHVFSVLDLPKFLQAAGIQWLGMLAPNNSSEIVSKYSRSAGELDVQEWHSLEQEHTNMFAGMYQFYGIKNS